MSARGVTVHPKLSDAETRLRHRDSSLYALYAVEFGNDARSWMMYYVIHHEILPWFIITQHQTIHAHISPVGGPTRLCFDIDYTPGKLPAEAHMDILGEFGLVYVLVESLLSFIVSGSDNIAGPLHFFVGVTPDSKKTSVHIVSKFALPSPDAALRVTRRFLSETTVPIIRTALHHAIIDQSIWTNGNFRIGRHRTRREWAAPYYHPSWCWAWRMPDTSNEYIAADTRIQSGIDDYVIQYDEDSPLGALIRGPLLPWPVAETMWSPAKNTARLAHFRQIPIWNALLGACSAPVDCARAGDVEFIRMPLCIIHGVVHRSPYRRILTDYRRHAGDPDFICTARCTWDGVEECCLMVDNGAVVPNDPYPTARD